MYKLWETLSLWKKWVCVGVYFCSVSCLEARDAFSIVQRCSQRSYEIVIAVLSLESRIFWRFLKACAACQGAFPRMPEQLQKLRGTAVAGSWSPSGVSCSPKHLKWHFSLLLQVLSANSTTWENDGRSTSDAIGEFKRRSPFYFVTHSSLNVQSHPEPQVASFAEWL